MHTVSRRAVLALTIGALFACGGDNGGSSTAPVDNSVARIDITAATALALSSGSTATLTATAFTGAGTSLGSNGITWQDLVSWNPLDLAPWEFYD